MRDGVRRRHLGFQPKALYGIDAGFGETKLTDVDYRGNEGIIGVIPNGEALRVQDRRRRSRAGADVDPYRRRPLQLRARRRERAGGQCARAGTRAAKLPRRSVARRLWNASPPPPAQVAAWRRTAAYAWRPPPEVCRQTLLDQLGTVGVNQVRQLADLALQGVRHRRQGAEHAETCASTLRGSACDDPRIKATLYDFDANDELQSITYVWERRRAGAGADLQRARRALSRFHTLPPPQSPGRLQADTSLGRLILQDMPERNLLLEAYRK